MADDALHPLVEGVAELKETMKLRLRWALSCETRAGRTETADWREEFAVPEGEGATETRATCRRARDAFDASWRRLEEATLALGRVQNYASHLAWHWHAAMEGRAKPRCRARFSGCAYPGRRPRTWSSISATR